VGCFKGNLASQIGALYAPGDLRRADAYQIYYLFISGSVIVAPLVTGTLGELYGWHYGFGAAGVGMLIGLAIYRTGRRWLPVEIPSAGPQTKVKARLTATEWRVVLVLILLLPVLTIGTVGNQQIFNAYLLWVPDHVDLVFFGHQMLTTWLITVDATVSILGLLGVMAFWRWWSKFFKEPSEIIKITIGFVFCVAGQLSLVAAAAISAGGQKAGVGWVLGFEVMNSIGFANVLPVGLALFARAAPKSISGLMIGVYFLHLFASNNLVGWLGGLLERLPGTQFWGLHAALAAVAALLTFIAAHLFRSLLAPGDSSSMQP
jgi:POT family proton-dependent oligopeptide transporter